MSFSDNMKKWVSIDDEIKLLNSQLREKREIRSQILGTLINYKTNNNLDGKILNLLVIANINQLHMIL